MSSRIISMSMRASAIQSWMLALSATGLAEGDPRLRALAHQLQCALGHADRAHAVVDAAGPEPGLADREALALALEHVLGGHPHVVEVDLGVALAVLVAEHRQAADDRDARARRSGRPSSTAGGAAPRWDRSCPSRSAPCSSCARRWRRTTCGRSARSRRRRAPSTARCWWHRSWPLAARSSRRPSAMVPSSSGLRYFSLCSSVPNSSSTSMLPVSGALQLQASDARWLRPMISASGAYSRLVRPGPRSGVRVEEVPQSARSRLGLELLHDRRLEVRVAGFAHLLVVHGLGRVDVRVHEVEQFSGILLRAIAQIEQ